MSFESQTNFQEKIEDVLQVQFGHWISSAFQRYCSSEKLSDESLYYDLTQMSYKWSIMEVFLIDVLLLKNKDGLKIFKCMKEVAADLPEPRSLKEPQQIHSSITKVHTAISPEPETKEPMNDDVDETIITISPMNSNETESNDDHESVSDENTCFYINGEPINVNNIMQERNDCDETNEDDTQNESEHSLNSLKDEDDTAENASKHSSKNEDETTQNELELNSTDDDDTEENVSEHSSKDEDGNESKHSSKNENDRTQDEDDSSNEPQISEGDESSHKRAAEHSLKDEDDNESKHSSKDEHDTTQVEDDSSNETQISDLEGDESSHGTAAEHSSKDEKVQSESDNEVNNKMEDKSEDEQTARSESEPPPKETKLNDNLEKESTDIAEDLHTETVENEFESDAKTTQNEKIKEVREMTNEEETKVEEKEADVEVIKEPMKWENLIFIVSLHNTFEDWKIFDYSNTNKVRAKSIEQRLSMTKTTKDGRGKFKMIGVGKFVYFKKGSPKAYKLAVRCTNNSYRDANAIMDKLVRGLDAKLKTVKKGTFGTIYKVQPLNENGDLQPFVYAIKFLHNRAYYKAWNNPNLLDEYYVSHVMMNSIAPILHQNLNWLNSDQFIHNLSPTIRVYVSESNKKGSVYLMDYHPYGDIRSIRNTQYYDTMVINRDLYVFKLLKDISFVLQTLWKHSWIDRDVGPANILIAGYPSDYRTTTFIKSDYGQAISKESATSELLNSTQKKYFCFFGVNASPLDVRVMYGKQYRDNYTVSQQFDQQLEQIQGAKILYRNLASIDLIDLSASAIYFYNLLTPDPQNRIRLLLCGKDYTKQTRRDIVKWNWLVLHKHYNHSNYRDPWVLPSTIEQMLIKIQWMTFHQLPELERNDLPSANMLNWNIFQFWLDSVYQHLY